ncbi:MAG: hypothetical protein C3F06_13485 [Candidatus Methanoperedenaceae archaeon]|nr:MAG: hypothetical protein C3F06_13485 [Candidatus Methanoperedenaceae archaeon]
MRIGIILHGPEIVDVGSARKIIGIFNKEHDVTAKLGGTMGRTAVLDAGLENVIDISRGQTPSETINAMRDDIDLAILLNHGKTLDTGRYFGSIVASRLDNEVPFVHIESPDHNGRIIYYYPHAKRCAEFVSNLLTGNDENYNLPVELGIPEPSFVRIDGDRIIRRIGGGFRGENIRLDGVVIGEITDSDIEIECRDGKITGLKGIKEKPHGIEKLKNRRIDLLTARVKTGGIRRTKSRPKIVDIVSSPGKIAIIDHAAESTFELIKGAGLVITIGDDTTTIAADILARLGVPVIGIIDGDIDGVLKNTVVPEGSIIIRVMAGFDDVVGKELSHELMRGKQPLIFDKDELTSKILAFAEKYVVEVTYY